MTPPRHPAVDRIRPDDPPLRQETPTRALGPRAIGPTETQLAPVAGITSLEEPAVPGSFLAKRTSAGLSVPTNYTSTIQEPSVGTAGDAIFQTGNWYATKSTNNGASFTFVNPFNSFPATPFAFSGGFCCDQRVTQDTSRGLMIWYLQYLTTNYGRCTTTCPAPTVDDTNGVRIAVTTAAGLATNTWMAWDITPAQFGFAATGKWLDFPHLQVSANYLYMTSNVFNTTGSQFSTDAVIGRIPLSALAAGTGFTMDTFVTQQFFSIAPVTGATTTMYFGSRFGSTSIQVLSWPESSSSPTTTLVGGLSTTYTAAFSCVAPDLNDPCGRPGTRMQTGWVTAGQVGFMWASSQDAAAGRPYPFVRTAILDPTSLTSVIGQPDMWSASWAFMHPAAAVNGRGHLAGYVNALGGTKYTEAWAFIRDDLSPSVATSGWETYQVVAGNAAAANGRWGDYAGATTHARYPNTWIGSGHVQIGGATNAQSIPQNFWFMRERDDPTPTITGLTPSAGATTGGTVVDVSGTNFATASGATTFRFGTTPAAAVSCSSATTCSVTAPSGSAGNVDVTATVGLITSAPTTASRFRYVARPSISLASPDSGPTAGGTSVTLTGTELSTTSGETSVRFGAVAATGVSCSSTTSCTATSPAGTGAVQVSVAVVGVASTTSVAYTYVPPPTVTAISPTSGVLTGGTVVSITGTGFATGATSVRFGALSATGISCGSATSCTATSPAGSLGTVHVTVTVGGQTSATSSASEFTYLPQGADLSLTLADSSDPVTFGGRLTYTATVANAGPAGATAVSATLTLPAGVSFVSSTPSQGSCSGSATVSCSLGALASGASATVAVVVTAPGALGAFSATAVVAASESDPLPGNNSATQGTTPSAFADVAPTDWAYPQMAALLGRAITTGCFFDATSGERRYCPDDSVTRAQMAAFLIRARSLTELASPSPTFSDVPATHWAYGWIERLYEQGITTGCFYDATSGERRYCPESLVPREQMAVFLMRAKALTQLASPTPTFSDVPDTHWAYGWIERLYAQGVTTGCYYDATIGERRYCPGNNVTRREMAVFLVRNWP